jgi:DNA-binding transcriptional ArsR family regulator
VTRLCENHIELSDLWFDELMPRLRVTTWSLFVALVRNIWRAEEPPGPPWAEEVFDLRLHITRGELAASVSIGDLARTLGLNSKTVRRHLRKLEQMELIQIFVSTRGRSNVYVLGYKRAEHCDWFADRVLASSRRPRLCSPGPGPL